jgi:Dehydrogenases with different specificities (related to short-chain alcohol dehydrogenases)
MSTTATTASSNFAGKVALVTGATSGIGRATALALAAVGAKVVLSGRREAEGQSAVSEIEKAGGAASFFRADASREGEVAALVDFTVRTYGRLDFAFNNAGVEHTSPSTEMTEADYRRVYDLNVWGVLAALKHEIPAMLRNGGGSIVNTSSGLGHIGMPGVAIYTGSKHAVEGITKSVALEFARQGIRVNAVAPAVVETEMFERFADSADKRAYLANLHPTGYVGRPEDIARGVLYLLDPANRFVTGTSLLIDGGYTAQ